MNATVLKLPLRERPLRRDQEFLPAALEILETPPSPVRMALMSLICALVVVALAWSYFGYIDIVAVAQGKVQPTGRVKVIQPLETGRVQVIHAENGQHVATGDVLIELDATEAAAEQASLAANLIAFEAEAIRRRAAIDTVRNNDLELPILAWAENVPLAVRLREMSVLSGDLAQLSSNMDSLKAQKQQKLSEIDRLKNTILAQKNLISTITERVNMRTTLMEKLSGTKASLIDATETLLTQQATLATEIGEKAEAEAGLTVIDRDMAKSRDAFLADNLQRLAEVDRQADDYRQRLIKAKAHTEHMTIRSPIAGVIQGSTVTTVGQVASVGEDLMRVVPDGSTLEIEAYLQNRDIGFAHVGQEAFIKVDSLPFTRYGTVPARVVRIATDAIPEPDAQQIENGEVKNGKSSNFLGGAQRTQNLVFPLIVHPEKLSVAADGAIVPLSPGMTVTVELKTGRRRIIEYIFSPLVEVRSEAMRER
ncbi:HlyD family type I secretion periplasmic adaptor subunit [Methylobacterium oryzae]|uniref:HlyD family type I secretion periplasmic adaptor subunit n=1 Tax=Methylobacterium oryzae TaxID=334852 RepID=UPI001F1D51D3|nr:HlyD family type I secretion periplasmic adaptor subunit [Methylobacterium oryzae]UIN38434.1 HlyD family type I secretion periplasmic adaptor subunit [Methylobacterium oryzae]